MQLDDARVLQPGLNFHLTPQREHGVAVAQLALEHDFQRHGALAGFFTCQVHVPKLALANGPAQLKVVSAPLPPHAEDGIRGSGG